MRKVVASGTLDAVDWNADLVRGDAVEAVRRLKEQPGRGISLGGVKLPATLAAQGLIGVHVRRASRDCGVGAAAA